MEPPTLPSLINFPFKVATPPSLESKNELKAYQKLAMDLIFLCRLFVQAREQSLIYTTQLRTVLIATDDALRSAAEAGNRASSELDEKFVKVINMLDDFDHAFYSEDPLLGQNVDRAVIEAAKRDDMSEFSLATLSLHEDAHSKTLAIERSEPTRAVEFHLLSSLSDAHPIVVKQVISDNPSLQEILWNFSRLKNKKQRLTLRENPHFYADLPTSLEAYGDGIKIDPTEDFQHADTFYVLTDRPNLVCITTDQDTRYFGNFWCPQNAVIFKDICGRLAGELIIKTSLSGAICGLCKELPVSTIARGSRHNLPLITTQECSWMGWKFSTGSLPLHGSDDISLRICIGRIASDIPLLVPLPPTSEIPEYSVAYRAHIHLLDNDSLLEIFRYYRLEHEDIWNLRFTWRRLTHICRRWRYLTYDSSRLLDLCLLLTVNSLSIVTLAHLPPLPLILDYWDRSTVMARKDEDNIYLGLQQHGHVRRVAVRAPSPNLRMWLGQMNQLFPRLGDLSLSSTTTDEMSLILPGTLQAPDLRRLSLHGIGLPKGLPLLSSMIALSTLSLTHIRESSYFPPGHLVTQLQSLPHLEELSIGFAVPLPTPSKEKELLSASIPTVTLPTLKQLIFRGVGVYLENLVTQIHTPLLERLSLTLFFELTFIFVNLTQFIQRTKGLGCRVARVIFDKDGAFIDMDYREQRGSGKVSLQINCESLDWQLDSAAQVCGALGTVLSVIGELTLDLNVDGMPSDWENTLEVMLWHELLLPFIGVRKLHISSSLTLQLSQALQSDAGELVLELLPEVEELDVQLEIDHANAAFALFLEIRESVGRAVQLLAPPMPPAEPTAHREELEIPDNTENVGRPYRNQAMELTSICHAFTPAEEQTFDSYDELKSVFQVVGNALESATEPEAQKKISKEVDEKFKEAINALSDYEKRYHSNETVVKRMATAVAKDKSSLTILNKLKGKLRPTWRTRQ